jgi:hypothetical protein
MLETIQLKDTRCEVLFAKIVIIKGRTANIQEQAGKKIIQLKLNKLLELIQFKI